MKPKPILSIDATGDQVIVTGRRDVVEKALDLGCHYHVESEGLVQARVFDPVPNRGEQMANAAIKVVRFGKRKMSAVKRHWPWEWRTTPIRRRTNDVCSQELIEGGTIALSLLQK